MCLENIPRTDKNAKLSIKKNPFIYSDRNVHHDFDFWWWALGIIQSFIVDTRQQ